MTTKPIDRAELEELERVLATYGADRDRWPAAARLRFAPLLAGDAEARRMLSEARALDRLLDRAPVVSEARREALAARLVGEAIRAPRIAEPAVTPPMTEARRAVVVELDRAAAGGRRRVKRLPHPGWFNGGRQMPAAALLAASLLLGIFAGWSTQLGALLSDGWTSVEVSSAVETGAASELQQVVFGDEAGDTSEEDFL